MPGIILVVLVLVILIITITVILTPQMRTSPVPYWLGWLIKKENPLSKYNKSKYIIQQLNVQPGMIVLDIGCGPGRISIPLAEAVGLEGKIIAVDIQQGMLLQAKRNAEARHLQNIDFLQIDISKDELECQVDRALLVTVLGEIPDKEAALRNIFKALKPGGVLCIIETIFDPQHYQKREVVDKLTGEAGFHKIECKGNRFEYLLCVEKPEGV